jgi:hypothetical protein
MGASYGLTKNRNAGGPCIVQLKCTGYNERDGTGWSIEPPGYI